MMVSRMMGRCNNVRPAKRAGRWRSGADKALLAVGVEVGAVDYLAAVLLAYFQVELGRPGIAVMVAGNLDALGAGQVITRVVGDKAQGEGVAGFQLALAQLDAAVNHVLVEQQGVAQLVVILDREVFEQAADAGRVERLGAQRPGGREGDNAG